MTANETRDAIRLAMKTYEGRILNRVYWNETKGVFEYPYRISEAEVLRIAGIRSRSTLIANHHADIKAELSAFICALKTKAGKYHRDRDSNTSSNSLDDRLQQLAQTIVAQDYRIRELENELSFYRSSGAVDESRPSVIKLNDDRLVR